MDDYFFRTVMLIAFAIIVPIAAYYRIRSNATKEKLDRTEEGWPILVGLRVSALVHFAGIFAFVIEPPLMNWASLSLPLSLRFLGVVLAVLASVLWITTFHYLGKNLTDTVVTRKEHSLVTKGPYAYVRHPFYVAFALLILANSLATANWFIVSSGVLTFLFIYLRTSKEEAKLVERFGDAYRSYMRTTGRFFPKFK